MRLRRANSEERSLLRKALRNYRGPRLKDGYVCRRNLEPRDFDPSQLAIGTKVELEHTSSPSIAMEIAMAHLYERSDYYARLERLERAPGGRSGALLTRRRR